jgi:hypothetical protein
MAFWLVSRLFQIFSGGQPSQFPEFDCENCVTTCVLLTIWCQHILKIYLLSLQCTCPAKSPAAFYFSFRNCLRRYDNLDFVNAIKAWRLKRIGILILSFFFTIRVADSLFIKCVQKISAKCTYFRDFYDYQYFNEFSVLFKNLVSQPLMT